MGVPFRWKKCNEKKIGNKNFRSMWLRSENVARYTDREYTGRWGWRYEYEGTLKAGAWLVTWYSTQIE